MAWRRVGRRCGRGRQPRRASHARASRGRVARCDRTTHRGDFNAQLYLVARRKLMRPTWNEHAPSALNSGPKPNYAPLAVLSTLWTVQYRRGVALSFVANHIAVHVIVITTVLTTRFEFKVKLLVPLDNKWIFKIRVAIGRSSKQQRPIGEPKSNRATGVICELNVPQLRMPVPNMDYWRVDKNSFPAPRDLYWWRKIDWHRRRYDDCSCSVWHFVSPFVN